MTTVVEPRYLEINVVMGSRLKTQIEIPPELQVLEGIEEPPIGQPAFRIVSQEHGDKRITWDCGVLAEINAAKKMFVDLVKQGLTPFRVGLNGKKSSEVMKEFDPHAEEIIFMPTALVAGG